MDICDIIDKNIDSKPKQTISIFVEYLTGDKYWTAENISKSDIKALEELVNYINKGEE